MIKVWQAKNNPPHDVLPGPLGHIGGLPCRRHAQHSMRLARAQDSLEERKGDLLSNECSRFKDLG
jgi:hypothetical protein